MVQFTLPAHISYTSFMYTQVIQSSSSVIEILYTPHNIHHNLMTLLKAAAFTVQKMFKKSL